ncbi:unnamed protein product [Somion occarium]|uniref:Ion transport domain-containing protein n=1 Tax=Somion occarium TaxID=3059160 RepID=A0ABP1E0D6_9APHY
MSEHIPLAGRHGTPPDEETLPHGLSLDSVGKENVDDIHPPWKRNLYLLLEHPASSQAAFLIHVFTTSVICVSAIITVLETVPAFHSIPGGIWFGLETSLVVLFTVEYTARCIAHSNTWRGLVIWLTSFFGIIDLLGILPYYIEIALQQDTSTFFRFTILRTFRLLRVFRPFRHNNTLLLTIEVMILSFRRSQHALLALAFFVAMVLVVFSTLLYFAERGSWDETLGIFINSDGDPSQFASIPAAAWFVLVTITTVGYGEITPRSFLGRLVTLPLLVFGLLLIALPTFVLGREFSLVWDMMHESQIADEADGFISTPSGSPILRRARASSIASLGEPLPERLTNTRSIFSRRRHSVEPQGDLVSQIADLKATVEMQGDMMRRLLLVLEKDGPPGKGKQRAQAPGIGATSSGSGSGSGYVWR